MAWKGNTFADSVITVRRRTTLRYFIAFTCIVVRDGKCVVTCLILTSTRSCPIWSYPDLTNAASSCPVQLKRRDSRHALSCRASRAEQYTFPGASIQQAVPTSKSFTCFNPVSKGFDHIFLVEGAMGSSLYDLLGVSHRTNADEKLCA
jgi:hypothetical protein